MTHVLEFSGITSVSKTALPLVGTEDGGEQTAVQIFCTVAVILYAT